MVTRMKPHRRLRLGRLAATSAGTLAALATSGAHAAYAVFNPYVPTQTDFTHLKINRLLSFGDSYSDPDFSSDKNWAEQLVAAGGITRYSPMALMGATACNCVTNGVLNSFQEQLDRWFR